MEDIARAAAEVLSSLLSQAINREEENNQQVTGQAVQQVSDTMHYATPVSTNGGIPNCRGWVFVLYFVLATLLKISLLLYVSTSCCIA